MWLPVAIRYLEEVIEYFGTLQLSLVCAAPPLKPRVASGPDMTDKARGQKLRYLGFMRFIAVRARPESCAGATRL
jgi:hypothetical protein